MGERSFWAWGDTDKLPGAAERERLRGLAAAFLGGVELEPRPVPVLEGITIPGPRFERPGALAGFSTQDRRSRASHTYGKSYRDLVRGLAGDFAAAPDLVATPRSEEEIEATLEWAAGERVAVVPYGGGTSVVGGVEGDVGTSFRGVISLDTSHLDQVLEVDEVSRAARIGAGVLGPDLERQLGAHGLTLRFYPQSFEFSTLGGWIATRAGGHFATVETHIDDLVESTRAITGSGLWQTRRLPASGAGPSPDRLMIGSEGALGVITEAWVRVRPRPRFRSSAAVGFAEWSAATGALRAIAQSGLRPSNCRLLDKREAMLHQVAADGQHILLLGFEADTGGREPWMDRALALALAHGGTLRGEVAHRDDATKISGAGAQSDWRDAFLRTPYLFSSLVTFGVVVDTFETACTWDQFDVLHRKVIAAARDTMRSLRGVGLVSTRVTHVYPDGLAPYYTFITTADRGGELEIWQQVKGAVSDALLEAGGTITHHHAVGRVHMPWYQKQRPALFGRALAAAKRELDPAGVLNPGVLIPSP